MDPVFWLALSLFLVAISLTAVLMVAVPAIQEVGRAARSVEKLFDTLSRDLPPTLEAIRLTGLEISELTDDVTDSVKSAAQAAKQVEESIADMRQQAQTAQGTTRSVVAGVRAAWQTFTRPDAQRKHRAQLPQRSSSNLQPREDLERSPQKPPASANTLLGKPLQLPPRSSRSSRNPVDSIPLDLPEEVDVYEEGYSSPE
jgi:uncharacterized protein YoxC